MELEFPGADSFLDVVTNIVGILIILIVVIGVRAKNQPVEVTRPSSPLAVELDSQKIREAHLQDNLRQLAEQIQAVKMETASRAYEREVLSTLLTAAKRDMQDYQSTFSQEERQLLQRQSELAALRSEFDRVKSEQTQVAKLEGRKVTVENLPTPIARSVEQNEFHFQLRDGRIVYVPMTELIEKFSKVVRDRVSRVGPQDSYVDSVGPLGGFVMHYTLARKELDWDAARQVGAGAGMIILDHAEFIPVTPQMGETLPQAMAKGSEFQTKLDEKKALRATITLWVYPDSFEMFRTLRKDLYQRGYAVAGRPMPFDLPISASSGGTKSAAE
jgi:hypothetical protein